MSTKNSKYLQNNVGRWAKRTKFPQQHNVVSIAIGKNVGKARKKRFDLISEQRELGIKADTGG